ncbi:MAG: tRNA (adenosine(37)-N6)-threonylcarbamoyltransferase complex transferase subunit TsaD [Halanaerobiaceae bacterium]
MMKGNKDIYILAVETSCDETAAAVTKNGLQVLSNVVASQVDWHSKFGGVVPELASRKHLEFVNPVLTEALQESGVDIEQIDAVAVTYGPGLVGSLLVGLSAAKTFSYIQEVPLIGVNHITGHIYANFISHPEIETPVICLTVSGGHTDLLYFEDLQGYEILGRTRDDAAGEAFDKVARFLDLGYPGGPAIEELAREGNPEAVDFPQAQFKDNTFDFSFSGLKTAVINYVHNKKQKGEKLKTADIAASFQQTVIDMLTKNVVRAAREYQVKSVVLSGGVAANQEFRHQLENQVAEEGLSLFYPELKYCTDNAAMIGAAAYYQYLQQDFAALNINPEPGLKL